MTRVVLPVICVNGPTAQFVQPVGDAPEGKAFLGGVLFSLVAHVLHDAVTPLSSSMRLPAPGTYP
ncbi:hypothetical protein OIE73_17830 [Streptomyces hirsutus]|uniref:Uncharacterized protein n=2 Tax=Streptomyces TaxID=1883 RepID=A0ABZ1GMW4_9ACTN|nr:hypothetical protein [Streptomyces hirsutus]WSD07434.1 hypothetical protein OIE73_17830 [Streptomyces hirsutus]